MMRRVLLCLTLGVLTAAAQGQQQFELGDDDTWIETTTLDPETPAGRLAIARRALAAGDEERAAFLATQWIDRHPRHPLLAEAYLIRGDALVAQRELYDALFDYELVARRYAGSESFITALEREYDVAVRFLEGEKRKFLGIRWLSAVAEAEELLIRIQERLPGSTLAEKSALRLADYYFTKRDMPLAAEMYGIFIQNFPHSEHLAIARRRLVYAYLADFKGPEHDASGLEEARSQLRRIQAVSPSTAQKMGAGALLTRIDDSIATKRLTTAQWYARRGDYIAAEYTIRRMIDAHPRSIAAAEGVRFVASFLDRLPASVRDEAPDYAALAAALDSAAPARSRTGAADAEDAE